MFKKATSVNQQKLRGDLVKRLKKDLTLQLELSDDDVEAAFPAKADVLLVKMSNRAVVYTVAGQPLVFDPVRCGGHAQAAPPRTVSGGRPASTPQPLSRLVTRGSLTHVCVSRSGG